MPQPQRFLDLTRFELDRTAMGLLPLAYCQRHQLVILGHIPAEPEQPITVGMLTPDNLPLVADVRNRLARDLNLIRLNQFEVERALAFLQGQTVRDEHALIWQSQRGGPEATVREMVDAILQEAIARGASDVHIESYLQDVDLRFRVDGILHHHFTHMSPHNVHEVISRLKIMASLDITERRRPQDGRFRVSYTRGETRRPIDFRLSVVPSPSGEDAVLRVLDAEMGLIPLSDLGMPPQIEATFARLLANPEGLLLVTGPTGSGKTTTLYAALVHMRNDARKIITAEDPIEYYLDKISQKQVSEVMDMAALTRALMRQDPDVLLYGEIRDQETGDNAITAAATGHLVLSTLHTPDAVGAVDRLRTLGLDDNDIASAFLGVLAQRLVRRICPSCVRPTDPTDQERALFGVLIDELPCFEGAGCPNCRGVGYKGRLGLFELLVADEELQDMIARGQAQSALRHKARQMGTRFLMEDGLDKVQRGETTLAELMRVLPYRHIVTSRQDAEATPRATH